MSQFSNKLSLSKQSSKSVMLYAQDVQIITRNTKLAEKLSTYNHNIYHFLKIIFNFNKALILIFGPLNQGKNIKKHKKTQIFLKFFRILFLFIF